MQENYSRRFSAILTALNHHVLPRPRFTSQIYFPDLLLRMLPYGLFHQLSWLALTLQINWRC